MYHSKVSLNSNTRHFEKGVVLIEFAIIIPVLALLIFGSLELARVLRHVEVATTLSREAASTVLIETALLDADYKGAADQRTAFKNSLQNTLAGMQVQANILNPGTRIIVSRFAFMPDSSIQTRQLDLSNPDSIVTVGAPGPLFHAVGTVVTNDPGYGNGESTTQHDKYTYITLNNTRRSLVVAEVLIPFNALVPGITTPLGIGSGKIIYDATVL